MSRSRLFAVAALGLAFFVAALAFWLVSPSQPGVDAPRAEPTPVARRSSTPSTPQLATPELEAGDATAAKSTFSPLAAELNAPSGTPQRDLEILQSLTRQYLRRLHHRQGLPIGDDIDLARALTGKSPLKIALLPPDHPALSPDGHLRDRWGTPYFLHPRSHGSFEIRSAGPDRKLFTEDDIILLPGQSDSSGSE